MAVSVDEPDRFGGDRCWRAPAGSCRDPASRPTSGRGNPRRRAWRSARRNARPAAGPPAVRATSPAPGSILEPLSVRQPRAAQVHCEWGLTLAAIERAYRRPRRASSTAVALKRDLPEAWRAIGDLLGPRPAMRTGQTRAFAGDDPRLGRRSGLAGGGRRPLRRPARRRRGAAARPPQSPSQPTLRPCGCWPRPAPALAAILTWKRC